MMLDAVSMRLLAAYACECQIRRFAALNDAADYEALVALFTEDGVFARPSAPEVRLTGRAEILAAFRARPPRASRHVTANVLVDVLGPDEARATSQILLYSGTPGPAPVQAVLPSLVGSFDDWLVRIDGEWRFRERLGRVEFAVGG